MSSAKTGLSHSFNFANDTYEYHNNTLTINIIYGTVVIGSWNTVKAGNYKKM